MKRHECPTCGEFYNCTHEECSSPVLADCFCCYVVRHRGEIEAAWSATLLRLQDKVAGPRATLECA